jgi:hypothetical protein
LSKESIVFKDLRALTLSMAIRSALEMLDDTGVVADVEIPGAALQDRFKHAVDGYRMGWSTASYRNSASGLGLVFLDSTLPTDRN